MIIFLYGQDDFRSRLKLKEIIDQYQNVRHSGLNLFYIDFKENQFNDFKEKTETVSIFAKKKLIILSNLLTNQDLSRDVLDYFKKNGQKHKDDVFVFFEKDKFSIDNPLLSFLNKTAKVQEFKPLAGKLLYAWAEKEVKRLKSEIDPVALKRLISSFNSGQDARYTAMRYNDLWRLSNEIKKLVVFKNRKKVEIQDVELLTELEIETNIFKTIDAIASLNREAALRLLSQHLKNGDSPIYLLTMINYQFRNILVVKSLLQQNISFPMILKASRLNSFVAKKCYSLAGRFSFQRLKGIYSKILETDLKIKTGKVSPRQGLELLVSQI